MTVEEVIGELKKQSGVKFDPNIVEEFISILQTDNKRTDYY